MAGGPAGIAVVFRYFVTEYEVVCVLPEVNMVLVMTIAMDLVETTLYLVAK